MKGFHQVLRRKRHDFNRRVLAIKVAVYTGIVGTMLLGIYPGPFIDWAVNATLMFSDIATSTASTTPHIGG